jgi:hypothetical protein
MGNPPTLGVSNGFTSRIGAEVERVWREDRSKCLAGVMTFTVLLVRGEPQHVIAAEAVDLREQAIAVGRIDSIQCGRDPDPLRERDDFRRLLTERAVQPSLPRRLIRAGLLARANPLTVGRSNGNQGRPVVRPRREVLTKKPGRIEPGLPTIGALGSGAGSGR